MHYSAILLRLDIKSIQYNEGLPPNVETAQPHNPPLPSTDARKHEGKAQAKNTKFNIK